VVGERLDRPSASTKTCGTVSANLRQGRGSTDPLCSATSFAGTRESRAQPCFDARRNSHLAEDWADSLRPVRIGVYIDGYNLYYGARELCGRGTPGWRWLDVRALTALLVGRMASWRESTVDRVVYCTAVIDAASNQSGFTDQNIYLRALVAAGCVDHIAYGSYVSRVKYAPLAIRAQSRSRRPQLVHPDWPIMVQDAAGNPIPDATFVVSYAHREEKGSDVNVASHLLVDVLTGQVDAAIVISNDSDLEYPIAFARTRVPVGLVNPSPNQLAGALRGNPTDGVGNHWWQRLTAADLRSAQLPDPIGALAKPVGW
jgi:hypothetical protein